MPFRPLPAVAAFVLVLSAALAAPDAQALSRREEAAVKALQQRLDAAEKRYRDAQLAEDPEAGAAAGNAALAEIKVVVEACAKQKGCTLAPMLALRIAAIATVCGVLAALAPARRAAALDPAQAIRL